MPELPQLLQKTALLRVSCLKKYDVFSIGK